MVSDQMNDILTAAIRFVAAVIVNRNHLKLLALSGYVLLLAVIFTMQPAVARARDASNMNTSPDEIVFRLKTRLNLTEDQETKLRPIIEESIRKRQKIMEDSSNNKKAIRSQLQELRWSTDMQIGKILTDEQMKEYQSLREEQREKSEGNETHSGRGFRGGRHGFQGM